DLDFRGAGSLFGYSQSGSGGVGFEFFSKLIGLAVKRPGEEEVSDHISSPVTEATFSQAAQDHSDHQETKYSGGNMGYIVRGEVDAEGEPRLDPVLEDVVFAMEAGQISPILKTEFAYHIFRVDHILEVYGQKEIKLRRIDVAVSPTDKTKEQIRELAEKIQERATAGESVTFLITEHKEAILRDVNAGQWLPLNEMDDRWQYSVRRLEKVGEVTTTVMTDRGVHIFQLVEKQPTPTFTQLATEFEAQHGDWLREEYERRKPKEEKKSPSFLMGESSEETEPNRKKGKSKKNRFEDRDGTPGDDDSIDKADRPLEIFQQHNFQGSWQNEREVSRQARQLNRGETSDLIQSKAGYHLIDVNKKRTYRGDLYLYGNDQFSYSRKDAMKIGQQYVMRWGHYHSIYTPWDNPEEGRKPLNFMGRVEWQARYYGEGYGTSESSVNSFGVLTWGSAFSALDDMDRDEDGNLRFSTKTIGEFLGRLQFSHVYDLIESDSYTLQKLPELSIQFSRMRMSNLPLLKTLNEGMVKIAEKTKTEIPLLSLLAFPTLEDTSFDLDMDLGNFYRQK
ncbi:MAG: peptidylprolyl isomerase, partial [Candidatus Poribacteria bacterium]|nr:peptidylprolyl isomerase [Candidatus Poribacteria bacterium]